MVVCKFFQQGYCRFGQGCRFEHIYGSKYSYHASATTQQPATNQNTGGVTDEQLVNTVHTDIQSALKGGQWILSCYAPFKVKLFPDLHDLSPEEARLFIYEAKANNKLDEAVAYINNLTQETRQKYEQLLQPNAAIVRVLRSLYNGENPPSPFTNTNNQSTPAGILFRSAAQSTPSAFNQNSYQSVFGQQAKPDMAKSIFAQATQNVFANQASNNIFASTQSTRPQFASSQVTNQNVFAQNTAAKSIFAQANQNVFASTPQTNSSPQNVFAAASRQAFGTSDPFGQQKPASDPFGQQKPASDPFGQQKASNDPFGQQKASNDPFGQQTVSNDPFRQQSSQSNPLGQHAANSSPSNIFQTTANSTPPSNFFGGNVFVQATVNDIGVYSKEEELSDKDLEAFKSDTFKLGFVPEIAPPHSLCV